MCSIIITVASNQENGVRDVVWLVEFASHCQSSGFQLPGTTQAAVVDTCNSKAEAEGQEAQSDTGLHSEFEMNMGNGRLSEKKKRRKIFKYLGNTLRRDSISSH